MVYVEEKDAAVEEWFGSRIQVELRCNASVRGAGAEYHVSTTGLEFSIAGDGGARRAESSPGRISLR